MSTYKITVINRTGKQVCTGIDPSGNYSGSTMVGSLANGVLNPGVTSGFVFSGNAGPYQVGYITVLSGNNMLSGGKTGYNGIVVYDVYPNAIVTIATEVGARPSEAADKE
ncbi:MAG TPA: hypothetical protein VLT87_03870 [Thermoanaerobaculia bacterium]|nr:hypothetical protein [Thermoanaerobaculia bacterium]